MKLYIFRLYCIQTHSVKHALLDWKWMNIGWSSLQSQIAMVYQLDLKHPLPYLDPRTLFQKLFEVFLFTQTKLVYKNANHLVNYKIRPPPPSCTTPPPPIAFFPHPPDLPCPRLEQNKAQQSLL